MYKIIKSDQTIPSNGISVKPFNAPDDERTLSIQFETYEKAAEHIYNLQKIKDLITVEYRIVKI